MAIDSILKSLEKVKKVGAAKWRAPCPVHNGKDLNLVVSERSDASVGCYCFVCGANGMEVAQALGLPVDEIFAPDSGYKKPVISRQMEDEEIQDKLILAMAEAGQVRTLADKRRVKLAEARLQGINELRNRYV